jgi:PAS domain S-box-containing protein
VVTGPKAEILMANPAAVELLGITEDQLLGATSFNPKQRVIHEDGSPGTRETHSISELIATGQPMRNVLTGVYRPALHDLVWLLVNAQPQFAPDGQVTRVVCSFEDITERKRLRTN